MTQATPLRPWLLACLALAAVLRLQGLGWDGWHLLHPDERNLIVAAQALRPGNWVTGFHVYNGLSLAAPKALAVALCGQGPGAPCIAWTARLLSALLACGTVLAAAAIAQRLGGPRAALAAALLTGLSAPLIQWAHFGTTESALTLAVVLLWWQSLRWLAREDDIWRTALLWGLVLGLGLGMKTTAAAFGLIPLTALVLRRDWLNARGLAAIAAGLALTAGLFVLTTPALLSATADWLTAQAREGRIVAGREDVFWTWQFAHARPGRFEAAQLWRMLDGTGALLALAGFALALARPRAGLWVALPFALAYLALMTTWHARYARYLAPLLPVALVLAALAFAALWDRARGMTARIVLLAALALPALTGLATALSFRAPDPRLLAAEDLRARLRPGDRLLVEPHDPGLTDLAPARVTVLPLLDPPSPAKDAAIAADLAGADWMLIHSRRHWAVLPGLTDRFPEACPYYAALADGRLGWQVVARFRRATPLGPLIDPDLGAEETRAVFDRPQVLLLANKARLSAEAIAAAMTTPAPCAPATLAAHFGRAR